MKLQTRQEIVDGVEKEMEYYIEVGMKILRLDKKGAKELYELLKEKFEPKN